MQTTDMLIWSQSSIRVPEPVGANQNASWPDITVEALKCALYYSVESHNSTVINGALYESLMSANSSRDPNSWAFTNPSSQLPQVSSTLVHNDSIEFNNYMSWMSRSDFILGDDFKLPQATIEGISSFIQSTFAISTVSIPVSDLTYGQNQTGTINVPRSLNGYYIQFLGRPSYGSAFM